MAFIKFVQNCLLIEYKVDFELTDIESHVQTHPKIFSLTIFNMHVYSCNLFYTACNVDINSPIRFQCYAS